MTDLTNRLTEMLGVDANSPVALRQGLSTSPFNPGNLRIASAPVTNEMFTHFNIGALPAGFTEAKTSGSTAYTAAVGGEAILTSGATAALFCALYTPLNWAANRQTSGQPLVAECRLHPGATITASEYFFGFTDAVVTSDFLALSTTSTFTTSVASDAAIMGMSATPTSGGAFTTGGNQHVALASKAGVDSVVATGGGAYAASTYVTYRIEIDLNGTTRFYVNGSLLGTNTTGMTVTTPLNVAVWGVSRASVATVTTVDYIGVTGV